MFGAKEAIHYSRILRHIEPRVPLQCIFAALQRSRWSNPHRVPFRFRHNHKKRQTPIRIIVRNDASVQPKRPSFARSSPPSSGFCRQVHSKYIPWFQTPRTSSAANSSAGSTLSRFFQRYHRLPLEPFASFRASSTIVAIVAQARSMSLRAFR